MHRPQAEPAQFLRDERGGDAGRLHVPIVLGANVTCPVSGIGALPEGLDQAGSKCHRPFAFRRSGRDAVGHGIITFHRRSLRRSTRFDILSLPTFEHLGEVCDIIELVEPPDHIQNMIRVCA